MTLTQAPGRASVRGRYALRFGIAVLGLCIAAAVLRVLAAGVSREVSTTLAAAFTILVPGWAAAGALGLHRTRSSLTAWGLVPLLGVAVWAPAGLVGLLVGLPFVVVMAAVGLGTAAMLATGRVLRAPAAADAAGLAGFAAFGAFAGRQWQSDLIGDGLFHSGVVGKLLAVSRPDERNIWPFLDGHPHAGYAFPALHLPQAAAMWVAGLNAGDAYADLVPVFAAMLGAVAYAVGTRSAGRAGGVVTALLALWLAAGENVLSTAQQPRYFVTLIAVPSLLLLLIELAARRDTTVEALVVACIVVITACHLTYTPPLLVAMAAVALFNRQALRATLVSAAISIVYFAVVFAVALHGSEPSVPVAPLPAAFIMLDGHRVALSGLQLFVHRAELVLAVAAVVWGVLRPRSPAGVCALVAAAVYLLCMIPGVVTVAGAVMGLGQIERLWELIPWPYVLGPVIVQVARTRLALPIAAVALVASLVLERTRLLYGTSADVLAVAGAVAIAAALVAAYRRPRTTFRGLPAERPAPGRIAAPVLAGLVLLAVLAGALSVHTHAMADALEHGRSQPNVADRITPGALSYFRSLHGVPVVLAPYAATPANWYGGIAYELVGKAPVYAVAMSRYHTQSERKDSPAERRLDVDEFLDPATSQARRHQILERWKVDTVAVDLRTASPQLVGELDADPALTPAYRDPAAPPGYARLAVWTVDRGRLAS